jgi:hypothetical protein
LRKGRGEATGGSSKEAASGCGGAASACGALVSVRCSFGEAWLVGWGDASAAGAAAASSDADTDSDSGVTASAVAAAAAVTGPRSTSVAVRSIVGALRRPFPPDGLGPAESGGLSLLIRESFGSFGHVYPGWRGGEIQDSRVQSTHA